MQKPHQEVGADHLSSRGDREHPRAANAAGHGPPPLTRRPGPMRDQDPKGPRTISAHAETGRRPAPGHGRLADHLRSRGDRSAQPSGAMGVGGDAGEVEAPGAVLDEDQGVQAFEGHGVEVQEIGSDDAVGLGGEKLAPGRSGSLRGRVDAGSVKDLPDSGGAIGKPRRASSLCMRRWPQVLFSRANRRMSCLSVGAVEGRPGRRRFWANVHFRLTSSRCQRSSVVGVTAKTSRHRSRGTNRDSAASQIRSAGPYRTRAI
jgi:hypothetical protein